MNCLWRIVVSTMQCRRFCARRRVVHGWSGPHPAVQHRELLRSGAAPVGSRVPGGCTASDPALPPKTVIGLPDAPVGSAESARRSAGVRVVDSALSLAPASADPGGVLVSLPYNRCVYGQLFRF
jgi:hypothetical protein